MRFFGLRFRDWGAVLWVLAIGALAMFSVSGRPQEKLPTVQAAQPVANDSQISRGKYIVEGVAMCGMCHTPRTDSGDIDIARPLDGSAVWLLPAHAIPNWPLKAPRLAGTPPASDEDMVRLLTTGIWTDGSRLRPPMPQFRMNRDDAEAVVAYLHSLKPAAGD